MPHVTSVYFFNVQLVNFRFQNPYFSLPGRAQDLSTITKVMHDVLVAFDNTWLFLAISNPFATVCMEEAQFSMMRWRQWFQLAV